MKFLRFVVAALVGCGADPSAVFSGDLPSDPGSLISHVGYYLDSTEWKGKASGTVVPPFKSSPHPKQTLRFDGFEALLSDGRVPPALHRPLFPVLQGGLRDAGVLIYETFMVGNERFRRPSNPDFLLRRDDLLDFARGRLEIVAFEQGEVDHPKPAFVQRLCAVKGNRGARLPRS